MSTVDYFSEALRPPELRSAFMADGMYKRIIEQINDFEADLPDDMQAGGRFVNFGDKTFAIEDVGYYNPNIIIFYATDPSGAPVQVLQHISQLNVLLVAVPRRNLTQPRRRIGFDCMDDD